MEAVKTSHVPEFARPECSFEGIIGAGAGLKCILADVERVAPTDSTVLVLGETGTGKELIARAIHNSSLRRGRPFIRLNCAAIPFELLESELFGHEKGAFTGAIAQKLGRFELADSGTLFLDEIGDLPLALQPKLLRVIQEHEFERLGSGRTHRVDFRLIAATHQDLAEKVGSREFRSDLYYRLNVFPIVLPPLRERHEDIAALTLHFAEVFSRRMKKQIDYIPEETLADFAAYSWPGNIRELQNLVERAVIRSSDGVLPNPLSAGFPATRVPAQNAVVPRGMTGADFHDKTLKESQRALISRALRAAGWVIGGPGGAAAQLGVPRTTLISKMKKLGITRQERLVAANPGEVDWNTCLSGGVQEMETVA